MLDPKPCPGDPDLVAYVRNGDLWVLRASTGKEMRLTYERGGKRLISTVHALAYLRRSSGSAVPLPLCLFA